MSNEIKEKSEPQLSVAQKNIIFDDIKKNVLVSAAAGSGKTHVLVEKIKHLLLDEKCDYKLSDILIMTFTVAATSEMKIRIKNAIESALEDSEINREKKDNLIKELALIENAKISTIDSFCKKILMENYHYLNNENSIYGEFDPAYRIADDKELNILYDSVLDEFLEDKYGDSKYSDIFKLYFIKTNDSELKNMLLSGLNHILKFAWPIDWIKNQIENYEKYCDNAFKEYINIETEKLYDYIYDLNDINKYFDDYIEILENANLKAENEKGKGYSEYITSFNIIKDILNKYANHEHNKKNHDLLIDEVKDNVNFPKYTKKYFDIEKEKYDEIRNKLKEAIDEIKNATKISELENVDNKFKYSKIEKMFLSLLLEYYIKIVEEKRKKNIYAISDYSVLALNILYDVKEGKRVISKRAYDIGKDYKLIFVDEYQDTNLIQEKILNALTTDENGNTRNNLFLVGDMKQSIYAFRNAEPKLFKEKEHSSLYNKYYLGENYRSKKRILDFINIVFENIMYEEFGDINYKINNQLILPDKYIDNASYVGPKVEVDVILSEEKKESDSSTNSIDELENNSTSDTTKNDNENDELKYTGNDYEAIYIANKIEELVKEGYQYKDIMILARTYSKFPLIIDALNNKGIPCFGRQKKGFFGRKEINLIIDLLKIIDNPLQDISLANVLSSELFSITDNELAYIKLIQIGKDYKNKHYLYLYDAVMGLLEYDENSIDTKGFSINYKDLIDKLNRFKNLYLEFSFKSRYISISELISLIYEKTYIKDIMATFVDGALRKANLDIFYENACSYEDSSYVGLFNFIRYIEKINSRTLDQELANVSLEDDNVVNMTTIHQSKGLQYKVVILCGCHTNYNEKKETNKSKFVYDDEYGISLNVYDEKSNLFYYNPKRKVIVQNKKYDSRKEEIRLLYVAMTRAIDKLVITGYASTKCGSGYSKKDIKEKITNIKDVMNANNYFDLIIPNLKHKETDSYIYKEIIMNDIKNNNALNNNIKKNYRTYTLNTKAISKKYESDSYKYKDLQLISPKISVSAIKESIIEVNKIEKVNSTINDSIYNKSDLNEITVKKLSGSDRGNAYHRYMQFLNFNTYEYDIHNENEYENYKTIDKNKIKKLLESDIGIIMTKAYNDGKLYREHKFMQLFSQNDINKYKGYDKLEGVCYDSEKVVLQGIIDAFYINDDNTITLIDYKTDMMDGNIEKDLIKNKLIANYDIQLKIYADVLNNLTGLTVKNKYIYSFAIDEWIEI